MADEEDLAGRACYYLGGPSNPLVGRYSPQALQLMHHFTVCGTGVIAGAEQLLCEFQGQFTIQQVA